MAGPGFELDPEVMLAAGKRVLEVDEDLDSQLRGLLQRLEPLRSEWRGQSGDGFQILSAAYSENARRLHEALRGIAESLGATHRNFVSADESSLDDVNRIRQALE